MVFTTPYIIRNADGSMIPAVIDAATPADLAVTHQDPFWQIDWESGYLSNPAVKKYALKTLDGKLVALAAYQIAGRKAYVYILYVESAPHSNPTLAEKSSRKYYGIGAVLIAFGIKYFMCHQTIEKGLKGVLVARKPEAELPYIHSPVQLAHLSGISDEMSEEQRSLLDTLAPLNIEARYPLHKERLLASLTPKRCEELIAKTEVLLTWLKTKC